MYRSGSAYDEIEMIAIDVLIDYGIKEFPLDVFVLSERMGVSVVKYSEFGDDAVLFKKLSLYGFYVYDHNTPKIFYNDDTKDVKSIACQHQTIRHEMKHYICNDTDDSEDDLAEYFGKYLACPIPLLVMYNITDEDEIVSKFGVSYEMAIYIVRRLKNRMKKYGNKLFEHEVRLVKHIDDAAYNAIYKEKVVN